MDEPLIKTVNTDTYTDTSNNYNEKITKAETKINSIKEIMENNIEIVIKRGENINNLKQKTDELNDSAYIFHKQTKLLRHALCIKNAKTICVPLCAIIFVVCVIILIFYFAYKKN